MALTITIPDGIVQLTGNAVRVEIAGASAPGGSEEYKLLLKITSTDAKLYGGPFVDAITPDGTGKSVFDISGYVDQPVTAVFQWPLSGVVKDYATQAFNISIEAGERYIDSNGDLVETWSGVTENMQLLKGGISPRQVAALRDAGSNFYEKYILGGKWLTARPWGDFVHPTQPVKMWFLPYAAGAATFRVTGYYDDNSTAVANTAVNLDPDKLFEFNCNPVNNGLTLEPAGKRMTYFEIQIVEISETRRFHFDWRYCEYPVS